MGKRHLTSYNHCVERLAVAGRIVAREIRDELLWIESNVHGCTKNGGDLNRERFFHPKLQAVEALAPYRLRTSWSTGEVLDVDIDPVLRSTLALANLLTPGNLAQGAREYARAPAQRPRHPMTPAALVGCTPNDRISSDTSGSAPFPVFAASNPP